MDDWDVSQVTNFNDMFNSLTLFNHPIDKWDVSNGITFVSKDQSVTFTCFALFPTWIQSQSITHVWLLKEQVFSTNRCFAFFSLV
jgi:hypothetical protein